MIDIMISLKERPGMPEDELLDDMIADCKQDLKDMLHVDELEDRHASILKELVLIKVNHDGVDGIASEGHGSVSTSYLDDLPRSLLRRIRALRKLPR